MKERKREIERREKLVIVTYRNLNDGPQKSSFYQINILARLFSVWLMLKARTRSCFDCVFRCRGKLEKAHWNVTLPRKFVFIFREGRGKYNLVAKERLLRLEHVFVRGLPGCSSGKRRAGRRGGRMRARWERERWESPLCFEGAQVTPPCVRDPIAWEDVLWSCPFIWKGTRLF